MHLASNRTSPINTGYARGPITEALMAKKTQDDPIRDS